jgi:FtsH-binding integral membrane protein
MMNAERKVELNTAFRVAVGIAVGAALLLVWMQGAVASENDSPGLIFFGVLVVGLIGTIIARFRPQGMARALFATALAQALVAMMAMIAWKQYLEISILNGFFIALWIGSALLFRKAARVSPESGTV